MSLLTVPSQAIAATSTTKVHSLGSLFIGEDGRKYRYALAGATALAAGKITIAAPRVANHTNIAPASTSNVAAGSTTVSLTLGATAATQDQYADGYLSVLEGTGAGATFRIAGNSAAASSGTIEVYLEKPTAVALAVADSKLSLVANPFNSTIISSGAVAFVATGVPRVAVPAGSYYWSQTGGLASVLSDGIITKAAGAIISDAVNGAVEVEVAGTVNQRVGYALEATVDTKYYPLVLTID